MGSVKYIVVALALLVAIASAKVHFQEDFSAGWEDRWVTSSNKQAEGTAGKFVLSAGKHFLDEAKDSGLQTSEDARFYTISASFDEFSNADSELVIQFSVKLEKPMQCGGAYLKVGRKDIDQDNYDGETPYNVMFGPDVCGTTRRVHFILNADEENHLIKREVAPKLDVGRTHVYTAVIRKDQSYQILVDGEVMQEGQIADDWDVLPPKEIPDPDQSKPDNWVDDARIPDPEASKPADWDDEPAEIADESATKPDDWDDELDGEWEAPMVPNPAYRGEWTAPMIDNPDYKGPWEHPMIANPDYTEKPDLHVYNTGSVAIEVWQVEAGSIFDNILIADSLEDAQEFLNGHFAALAEHEKEALASAAEEAAKAAQEEAEAAKTAAAEDDDEEEDEYEEDDDEHDEL